MRRLFLVALVLFSTAGAVQAKDTTAERYDVTIRTLQDGSIQVTETVRLTFTGGPFTYVSREIPTRRTDGLEVLGASMDGRVMPRGTGAGQFDVRARDNRVTVRWHFNETSDATHEFRLSYLARGVVQHAAGGGVLEWQALPTEHRYRIDRARIRLEGVGLEREPSISAPRVADARVDRLSDGWQIDARGIASNGFVAFSAPAPIAAAGMPRWQARRERERALAPRMAQFGGLAAALGLAVVLLVRRQSTAWPTIDAEHSSLDAPPAPRPPAFAAAILAGGRSGNAHAVGTLFDLAGRGLVEIAETERGWKPGRRFALTRIARGGILPHESALLDVLLGHDESVNFSKAAARLARGGRTFRHAVNEDLLRLGLTDEARRTARRRLFAVSIALLVLGLASLIPVFTLGAGGFGVLIMVGFDLAAFIGIVLAARLPELSDEGLRERERWRAFKRGLRTEIVQGSTGSMGPLRYLPYVAAFGLAGRLSRFLKKHGDDAVLPPWFRTLAGSDGSAAFAAFIGTSAATGGGHAGGSSAAGGGSSGAG